LIKFSLCILFHSSIVRAEAQISSLLIASAIIFFTLCF